MIISKTCKNLLFVVGLSLISQVTYPVIVNSKTVFTNSSESNLTAQNTRYIASRIKFRLPSRGAPRNTVGAATRGGGNRLMALLPSKKLGLTASNSPLIFVYVPKNESSFSRLTILDEQEKEIHQSILPSIQTEGIAMIQLPENLKLSTGKSYQWKFSLVDREGDVSPAMITEGWIEKISADNNLQKAYSDKVEKWEAISILAEKGVWQDTLEQLALLHLQNPEDQEVANEWTELLKSVGLNKFAKTKILPYVIKVQ